MPESNDAPPRASGQCLCGAVRYEVRGPLRPVIACHCTECRRFSGGIWTATAARREHLTIHGEENVTWYAFSDRARRGFCGRCGASLFFSAPAMPHMAIAAGTLNKPTGLKLAVHIFTAEAGDYYLLTDDLPKITDGQHGLSIPEDRV